MSDCSPGPSVAAPWFRCGALTAAVALLGAVACPISGAAEEIPAQMAPGEPPIPVCTSFIISEERFGSFRAMTFYEQHLCTQGHAVVSASTLVSSEAGDHERAATAGNCCPMPADALSFHSSWHFRRCPPDHVVTGVSLRYLSEAPSMRAGEYGNMYHCTKLNTYRYQLGAPTLALRVTSIPYGLTHIGIKWLLGIDPHDRVSWKYLPPALRYGIMRSDRAAFEDYGCAGYPWGSPLVGRRGATNCGHEHRRIEYRGLPGDPPNGTPVKMFEDCVAVRNPFSREPECVRRPPSGGFGDPQ